MSLPTPAPVMSLHKRINATHQPFRASIMDWTEISERAYLKSRMIECQGTVWATPLALMTACGTYQTKLAGQSMSALPGYFRHQLVLLISQSQELIARSRAQLAMLANAIQIAGDGERDPKKPAMPL